MKHASRWSPVVHGLEPITTHLSAPTLTVWRRCRGFVEAKHGLEDGQPHEPAFHIGRWLSAGSHDLRLHLVFKVGGAHRSAAWLGLSVVGGSAASERRLSNAALELAEALDTWKLFPDVPTGGPRYARHALGLVATGAARTHAPAHELPSVRLALDKLARLDVARALTIELRPSDTPAALVDEIATIRDRARAIPTPPPSPFLLFDASYDKARRLRFKANQLWQSATACAFRIRLHGRPPGTILRGLLEDALADDLAQQATFQDAPPTLFSGRTGPVISILHTLASGAPDPEVRRQRHAHRGPDPMDDIPF